MKPLILTVDDDAGILSVLEIQLSDAGYRVIQARDGLEAIQLFREHRPDVVLSDMRMPYKDGQSLLESILQEDAEAMVIMMTAFASVEGAVDAMRTGAFDFIVKPFRESVVLAVIERALKVRNLKSDNCRLRRIVQRQSQPAPDSSSEAMARVYAQAATVADTNVTVLIQGETGTGKEYLAHFICRNSGRSDGPWVVVNCGALPEQLIEAELFGHGKGAFTGAVAARKGRILSADGGTLFLDEVGDLPLAAQVKLLRFLQEGEIQPLGSDVPVKADVRVIAATHRDLQAMSRDELFREDLYYRLNVISLTLPPLCERGEDVPLLLDRFLRDAAVLHERQPASLTPRAMKKIRQLRWPGNVRQLKNMCERWALLYAGREIDEEMIREDLAGAAGSCGQVWKLPAEGVDLSEMERELIRQALERSGKNKTVAARLLGISRHTLDYRLDKHGISVTRQTKA